MDSRAFGLRDLSLFDSQGLIAGTWKSAPLGKSFSVIEPSSGNVLGQCANFGSDDFVQAIDFAYDGYQQFYASTTAKERGSILRRWNDLILENSEDRKIGWIRRPLNQS
jgi:succinate-semialdehyde dehydrogenase/glutarate-semialdehyde dehydrogenase